MEGPPGGTDLEPLKSNTSQKKSCKYLTPEEDALLSSGGERFKGVPIVEIPREGNSAMYVKPGTALIIQHPVQTGRVFVTMFPMSPDGSGMPGRNPYARGQGFPDGYIDDSMLLPNFKGEESLLPLEKDGNPADPNQAVRVVHRPMQPVIPSYYFNQMPPPPPPHFMGPYGGTGGYMGGRGGPPPPGYPAPPPPYGPGPNEFFNPYTSGFNPHQSSPPSVGRYGDDEPKSPTMGGSPLDTKQEDTTTEGSDLED